MAYTHGFLEFAGSPLSQDTNGVPSHAWTYDLRLSRGRSQSNLPPPLPTNYRHQADMCTARCKLCSHLDDQLYLHVVRPPEDVPHAGVHLSV